jgi:hypothetical protein
VEHIALMYAVLPFTIFLAPPLIGFLADKLGSYTKVSEIWQKSAILFGEFNKGGQ